MITKQKIYYVLDNGRMAYTDYNRAENYARKYGLILTDHNNKTIKDFKYETIRKEVLGNINDCIKTRSEHLEKYAAAFIEEVGSEKASQYGLVEEHHGNKIVWYFQKR